MREMKDSGVEWIDKIPSSWSIVPLKTMVSFGKGLPITKENLIEKGVAVVSYGQIHSQINVGSHLNKELVRYVSDEYLQSNRNCLAKKGDILIADTSEDYEGIGNSVLNDWDENLFAGYHTVIIRPSDRTYSKYLAYLFMTDSWRSQLRSRASGIKVFSVTQSLLKKTAIIIPRENSVQKITDYLDAKCSKINEIIEKQQAIIEKLREYKLSIITEIVTKGLKHNVKMKDSGVRFVDTIPYDWENRKMITILSTRVVDGPHESPELYDRGIPYISATAIVNGKIDFSLMRGYISKEYCEICDKRYSPQRGDLLVVKLGASTGQVAIVDTDERFNIWVPLAAVRCNDEALPKFVYYAFQSDYFVRQMELSWTFGTQQTLGVQTIEKLRILLPPIAEQRKIVKYLDTIYDYIGSKIEKVEKGGVAHVRF